MDNKYNEIDEEELERLEDELLEEEAHEREEDMIAEGRSVFEIDRLKREQGQNQKDTRNKDTNKSE